MIKINNKEFNVEAHEVLKQLKIDAFGKRLFNSINQYEDYLMISCPYHKDGQEKKPSAMLRNDGSFYCFACNEHKRIDELIYDVLGVDGIDYLQEHWDSVALRHRRFDATTKTKEENTNFVSKAEVERYKMYHTYLKERGISPKTAYKFDIGYSKELNSIMFPIKDAAGNVLYFITRRVDTKFYGIKKNVDKPLYGVYELLKEQQTKNINEIYLVEGMFDCLSVWEYGKYALAMNCLGSANQIAQLNSLPIRTVIIATDNDERGQKAKERLKRMIKGKFVKVVEYNTDKKDINSLTKEEFENLRIKTCI